MIIHLEFQSDNTVMTQLFALLLFSCLGLVANCFLYFPTNVLSDKVARRLHSKNKNLEQDEQTFVTKTITTSTILDIERRAESSVEKLAEKLVENSEQFKSIMKKCELMAEEKVRKLQHETSNNVFIINNDQRILSESDLEELENKTLRKWKIKKDEPAATSTTEAKSSSIGEKPQIDEDDIVSYFKTIIDGIANFLGSLLSTEPQKQVKHSQKQEVTLDVVDDWLGYIDAEFSEVNQDSILCDTKVARMILTESSSNGFRPIDRQTIERKTVSLDNALDYMRNALQGLGIQQNKYKE